MPNEPRLLTVNLRTETGKGAARRLRSRRQIPAVIYGQGKDHLIVSLDPHTLHKSVDPERKFNTWFELQIVQNGQVSAKESCVIADHQVDKIRGDLVHLDFLRVDPQQKINVTIPVAYTGRAVGVVAGGRLKTLLRSVTVAVTPTQIPTQLLIDVTPLGVGETLRIKNVSLEGARILDDPDHGVAFIEPPKTGKEETKDAPKEAEAKKK